MGQHVKTPLRLHHLSASKRFQYQYTVPPRNNKKKNIMQPYNTVLHLYTFENKHIHLRYDYMSS